MQLLLGRVYSSASEESSKIHSYYPIMKLMVTVNISNYRSMLFIITLFMWGQALCHDINLVYLSEFSSNGIVENFMFEK
jgi:hypothetical protein